MGYLGYKPADKPLTAADITDSIITSAKITDATIVNGDIANATIALAKLSATGTPSAATFLRGDNAWGEAGAAAGQVIQVVTATDSTFRSTSSTSFVTASNTLSVTITPSSSSNKIFLIVNSALGIDTSYQAYATIYRNSTDLGAASNKGLSHLQMDNNTSVFMPLAMNYLDSPATTSATTYQVYIRVSASSTAFLNWYASKTSITAFEIKG